MERADLLALTPEGLVSLANRGLVKRATKDVEAGGAPEPSVDADGTVHGDFGDGVTTSLPVGVGLEGAVCSCAATGMCRHIVTLVLAYQRQGAGPAEETGPGPAEGSGAEWSPGAFGDEELARVLGQHAIAAARRVFRGGYAARIRRPSADDPVAAVELPTCTVRFLVPGELGYVDTDAAVSSRGRMIVLAVWAFRAADEAGLTGREVRLDVGGAATAAVSGLESVLGLVDELLLDGAMNAGPLPAGALRSAARDLAAADLHWPAAALEDLAAQIAAYRDRDARYAPELFAGLAAELYARHRAALHPGGSPRSQILGTDERASTPLRHVRLTALGCRVGGTDRERTVSVCLAQAGSGIVLVLPRSMKATEDEPLTGHDLASRKIAGTALQTLAAAEVISQTASRSAGRTVRLGGGRLTGTLVTPLEPATAWADLPEPLLVRDLAALDRAMAALPPRLIRSRVAAELVRVMEIAEVRDLHYSPAAQRLDAVIADRAGATAVISATYSPHSPGALDALADALAEDPHRISGSVGRVGGTLIIDPMAVATSRAVVVPDLAPGDGSAALASGRPTAPGPLTAALENAVTASAEAAHRGLRHVPDSLRARIAEAAGTLHRTGLTKAAGSLTALHTALSANDPDHLITTWADAHIRLLTTLEGV
ncbi:hypothetical protein [Thermomonospora amylolytica]|uniref:hypothetical protein n=1 Tax=Thermomonospora amylolytica TaxID=1411117 RepID=UPI000E6CC355|nr:hypothetical protein [Thermomonospora amylolytica]